MGRTARFARSDSSTIDRISNAFAALGSVDDTGAVSERKVKKSWKYDKDNYAGI